MMIITSQFLRRKCYMVYFK